MGILGGIVSLFTIIAFVNHYISKNEFDNLIDKSEYQIELIKQEVSDSMKKSIEENNNFSKKIKEYENKIVEYNNIIDLNSRFVLDYVQYISADINKRNYKWYLCKFEGYLRAEVHKNVTYKTTIEIIFAAIEDVIEKPLHEEDHESSLLIPLDLVDKAILHLNNWLDYIMNSSFSVSIDVIENLDTTNTNSELNELYYYFAKLYNLTRVIRILLKEENMRYENNDKRIVDLNHLHDKLYNYFPIHNDKKNALYGYDSNALVYISFLESIIDLQIAYGMYGFQVLVDELLQIYHIRLQLHRIKEMTPFGSEKVTLEEIERIRKKYRIGEIKGENT